MIHIPHGLTYNDMLTEFTDTKYHWASRVAVIKSIKNTFKKLTTIGINELVSGYNYQQVIDTLSNAKIPHCTFADWLRGYGESDAQTTETEVFADIFEIEPEPEPLKVIDVFVAAYGEGEHCFDRLTNFLTKRDQYDCDHGITDPWEIVDDEVENHLRGWFRNMYPTSAQLRKKC